MNSIDLNAVVQAELPLSRRAMPVDVPLSMVMARKTLLGAINLCMDASGLDDKEIALALDIDAGHFANIRKGKGHFPPDKINALMNLCGNEAPVIWLANSRGYGLVMLKTEAERWAEEAERRAKDAEDKLLFLTKVMQGKVAA